LGTVTPIEEGWLPKGLRLRGKRELIAALRAWVDGSSAPTIGDTRSFHGQYWISADIGGHRVRLAADTTREAVRTVVNQVAANPARPWRIVANQRGRVNKVVVTDRVEPGWYAYVIPGLPTETEI
jgi:hypothetical protein